MDFPQFSAVRLTTDRFLDEGVGRGDIGYVLDVFDDGYDVEFSRLEDGSTIALLFVKAADLAPAPEVTLRSEHASISPSLGPLDLCRRHRRHRPQCYGMEFASSIWSRIGHCRESRRQRWLGLFLGTTGMNCDVPGAS